MNDNVFIIIIISHHNTSNNIGKPSVAAAWPHASAPALLGRERRWCTRKPGARNDDDKTISDTKTITSFEDPLVSLLGRGPSREYTRGFKIY